MNKQNPLTETIDEKIERIRAAFGPAPRRSYEHTIPEIRNCEGQIGYFYNIQQLEYHRDREKKAAWDKRDRDYRYTGQRLSNIGIPTSSFPNKTKSYGLQTAD